ncbi:MAG TPA: hypothetical protein VFK10_11290 [Burkholderiaceae bacterium]|nr:hypothetical protein [Burkholderiaceae bacterium]
MSVTLADPDAPPTDFQPAAMPPRPAPRSLSEAVAAVTEHCLQTELRRLKAAQARIADELATSRVAAATLDGARPVVALPPSPHPASVERAPRRTMPKPALRPRTPQAWPPLQSR